MQADAATLEHEAEHIVREIGIPPCPAVLTALVQQMRSDEPDFSKIGQFISSDPGLAAAVLKTINSPFYGLRTKANSVQQALALMGLRTVAQLVTGLLLRQAFPCADNEIMESFWEDSRQIATISAMLAPRVRGMGRDDAYTYGLFRDCGIPVLMLKFSDYPKILTAKGGVDDRRLTELEQESYRIDHTQVGHFLAKSWHLPESTCLAILCHHKYLPLASAHTELAAAGLRLIALGMIAEHLLGVFRQEPESAEWKSGGQIAMQCLGFSCEDLNTFTEEIHSILAFSH